MAVELRVKRQKRKNNENNNKDSPKRMLKDVSELKEFASQEIARLSDEICHLEEEIFQKESLCTGDYSMETLQRIVSDFCDGEESADLNSSSQGKSETDIGVLEKRLHSLKTLTGILFQDNKVSLISRQNRTSVFLRRLSGTCQNIPFSVEFEVEEYEQNEASCRSQSEESVTELETRSPVITRLHASITNPPFEQELSNFLSSVQQQKSLQLFFVGLMQYADWQNHRQRTFDHFRTKYPSLVHLTGRTSESNSMQVYNRNKTGIVFTVFWKLDITVTGHVVPDFQVHASTLPKCTLDQEKSSLLKSVPRQFHEILPLLGIEQSIETVIGIIKGG